MKTAIGCLLFFAAVSTSSALVTSTVFTEGFTTATDVFPPANWSTDGTGNFHSSANGDGGVNGSAMFDMYNACSYSNSDHLYSPQIDASAFGGSGATATLDFDYWMEQNGNDLLNGGNHLVVYVYDGLGNQMQLDELWSNQNYTFDNSGDFNNSYPDPMTDPAFWGHRQYAIPVSFRTSTMSVVLFGQFMNTCSGGNFGVDNVVVTGSLPQNITFAPLALTFGITGVGMTSTSQCVTLTNPGNTDIAINSILVQDVQPSNFQIAGPVPQVIPANGSADICVIFFPQSSGAHVADLLVTTASDNYPSIDIVMSGTGAVPIIEIDPIGKVNTSSQMFKRTLTKLGIPIEQCLLIKNTGLVDLLFDPATYISGNYSGEYTISDIPTAPISPGGSATLCVEFIPTGEGTQGAYLMIMSNASNGTQVVDLLGAGKLPRIRVTPGIINFDSAGIGQTLTRQITISNPGSDTLRISKNQLSSNDGDFTYNGLTEEKLLIAPGVSKNVFIIFTPLQEGTRQARLLIATNIPNTFEEIPRDTATISIDISGVGVPFGDIALSLGNASKLDSSLIGMQFCRPALLRNTGAADITVTSVMVSGNQASEFSITGITLPVTIPAQKMIPVIFCAIPGARGLRSTTLIVSGMSKERAITATLPITIFGELACASQNPAALFTNSRCVKNDIDTESVTITNCGDIPASYSSLVSGDGYRILSPAGGVSASVTPGTSATFIILFNPASTGVKNGNLLIQASNISDMNVPLSGEGACAAPAAQTFQVPKTGVGGVNTFDITIANTGNYDWTPGAGVITPADIFSVVSITPATIPAGGLANVRVQFAPKSAGLASAELTFPNSGPCEESAVIVDLSGEGVVSAVKEISSGGMWLDQNYPNPFVSATTFNYSLPSESTIRISLSDMTGNVVKELVSGRVSAGEHSVSFDASQLASGKYIYMLECGNSRLSKNLVLSK